VQSRLAASAPAIDVVNATGIHLTWQNVEKVTVSSIPMGVGLLFSCSPFAQ
jgi:hypothetical protein